MAVQVKRPQNNKPGLGQVLGTAASIAGAVAAPSPASIAGAAAGASNLLSSNSGSSAKVPAAQRRLDSVAKPQAVSPASDQLAQIQEAQIAAAQLPDEQKRQVLPTLMAARSKLGRTV